MSAVIEQLKELNLFDKDTLEKYIWSSRTEDLLILIEYLRKCIDNEYTLVSYSPFSFVPNDDLSGTGGCSELSCKIQRATNFSVFTALYADNVCIQLGFITSTHFDYYDADTIDSNKDLWADFRYKLECDISILIVYAELIEKKIVHLAPTKKSYCLHCFQKTFLGNEFDIDLNETKKYYNEKAKLVTHSYDSIKKSIVIKILNIDEFFPDHYMLHEHELTNEEIHELANENIKAGRYIKSNIFKNNFIDAFIDNEFISTCYYSSYCKEHNAKLITNKVSDSIFISMSKEQKITKNAIEYYNMLPKYDMPFVTDIDIQNILNLREVENESFNKYRIALNKAIKEQHKTDITSDWNQIYDDILFPAFNELDLKMKQIKTGLFKRTFASMGIIGTVIVAGKYGNIIPSNIKDLLNPIGIGMSTAGGNFLLDKYSVKKSDLQNNDYYFLWRLKNNKKKK